MQDPAPATRRRRDPWPLAIVLLHLGHGLWFATRYPHGIWDPDLVAYFVYFENWLSGTTALQHIAYFTVPKPLMVSLLGPLGSAPLAFAVSLLVSAALGLFVYLVARRVFGRTVAVVTALVMLLDVDRAVLTLRSSADLYLAMLLAAAVWCTLTRRYACSALAIGLAALAKPVALPCVFHLLAVEGPDRRRALRAIPLALLSVPLIAIVNVALLGSPSGSERFFAAFDAYHRGAPMSAPALLRFVGWVQLKEVVFGSTAAFGLLGLACWLGADRRRLASPVLLVPGLLLGGYVAMSLVVPFVPMSRFFWPIQIWFMAFVVFGMIEAARRLLPARPGLRLAVAALLVCLLADDLVARQLDYRARATQPFEDAMAFVQRAGPVLAAERAPGESVLTALAFLPWLVWTLEDARAHPELVRTGTGGAGDDAAAPRPDWIVYAPQVFLNPAIRARFDALLASGEYEPRFVDGPDALLVRSDRDGALAWSAPRAR